VFGEINSKSLNIYNISEKPKFGLLGIVKGKCRVLNYSSLSSVHGSELEIRQVTPEDIDGRTLCIT